jgi:pyrimidine-nucleoside phosphorylase
MLDLIIKKRDGLSLSETEIRFLVDGYVDGSIPEYQVSAWLMASFLRGLSSDETGALTQSMIESGDVIDLSSLSGSFVDKHSTGGVGDKVSLILAPIVASAGTYVPMMSGRSLGHTGGTLDKLESIVGYRTQLSNSDFVNVIRSCGFGMVGQTKDIVPADKLLYSLRDVTGTVESIPLITASIMSKKFAEGADSLVFDVKFGSGAFMRSKEDARLLSESLVKTGGRLGRKAVALITSMEEPLGYKVGNIANGKALECFYRNVELQGGDIQRLKRDLHTRRAKIAHEIRSSGAGFIHTMDAYSFGIASVLLGAGRDKAEDAVESDVGIEFKKKCGDEVAAGDVLYVLYGESERQLLSAEDRLKGAVEIKKNPPQKRKMIIEEISHA